jgi:hypothetical protein
VQITKQIKELCEKQKEDVNIAIWEGNDVIYRDQRGKFPHTSNIENKCTMVMFFGDASNFMMEKMRTREENDMIPAPEMLIMKLKDQGSHP